MKTPLSAFQADPSVAFTLTLVGVRHGAKQTGVPNDDALLTEEGVAQVTATGKMLSERFDRVIPVLALSSNLIRAKQTAQLLTKEMAYENFEVRASAGFGYQWLEKTLATEVSAVEGIAKDPALANATAAQMAEFAPRWANSCQTLMRGALSAVLNSFHFRGGTGITLPDGSCLGVLGNHSPMLEFLPNCEDWGTVTKRGPAAGIVIPVVVYNDGRVDVVPGAECFDAGLVKA